MNEAKDEDVNAYGMRLASERQQAMRWRQTNFSLPSNARSSARLLG